jgi:hypothetical protein
MQNSKRRKNSDIKLMASCLIILCLFLGFIDHSVASGLKVKTNINPVTDEFDKEIDNKQELESQIQNLKGQAEKGIEENQAMQELEVSKQEAETKTNELNTIHPDDLSAKGLEERVKPENSYYESLIVDYDSLGAKEHKKDMDLISKASGEKMSKLLEGLKSINIDCKEVKGNIEQEPEYKIDIVKEEVKDTVYDQVLCEELRNKYNCRDNLTLKCSQKSISYTEWQQRQILVTEEELDQRWGRYWVKGREPADSSWQQVHETQKMADWFEEDITHTTGGRGSWVYYTKIREWDPVVQGALKIIISNKLGVSQDNIGGYITTGYTKDNDHRSRIAYLNYQYRESYEICSQWLEDWSEVCTAN